MPVVFGDPRTGITPPRVSALEGAVREFGIDYDGFGQPLMALRGAIGATSTNPHFSFEEIGTIGWSMCRNNAAVCNEPANLTGDESCNGAEPTSAFDRARWSPYLHGLRRGVGGSIFFASSTRLRCPNGTAFAMNNPAAWNVAAFVDSLTPTTRPTDWHQNLSELIADRIIDGGIVNTDALAPHVRALVDAHPEEPCRLPPAQ